MATLPIYDEELLPCVTYPTTSTRTGSKKYLGNRGLIGAIRLKIKVLATSDAEMQALHTFWKSTCNYGLEPFLIQLPIFGKVGYVLAMFLSDFKPTKDTSKWDINFELRVLTTLTYIVNDLGEYVVDDAGSFVISEFAGSVKTGDVVEYI